MTKHDINALSALGITLGRGHNLSGSAVLECEPPTYFGCETNMRGRIGAYSYIRERSVIHAIKSIGRYCSIANDVQTGGGEHPTSWLSTHPFQYGHSSVARNFSKLEDPAYLRAPKGPPAITIGNDVWIGARATVRRGVTIGDGAIIGAGSLVVKDVPPFAIVGGVPAKIIRYRFSSELIERLLRVRWWNYTADSLHGVNFADPEKALDQIEKRIERGTLIPIPKRIVRVQGDGSFAISD